MATDTDKFKSCEEIESNRENNTKYFPLTAFDENGLVGFFTVRTPGDDDKKSRIILIVSNTTSQKSTTQHRELARLTLRSAK